MVDELTRSVVTALGRRCEGEALDALSAALETGLRDAKEAWPELVVSNEAFGRFLADRMPPEGDLAEAASAMRVSDLYLACGCTISSHGAAAAFERAVVPAVRKAVARVDSDPVFLDDVVEAVRVKLLVAAPGGSPKIASYLGGGPLTSFAQVVGLREAQSEKRKKRREVPLSQDALLDLPFESGDAELARLKDEVRGPFRKAFREALAELSPRDRNVLRLYLVAEVPSEVIAGMYRVHRGTVARWVAAARQQVLSGTRRRLMKELRLGRASFDSLVGRLAEDLDITLSTFLDEES